MRYVLYFQPRSGSTLVCSRLNSGLGQLVNGFEIIDAQGARLADLLTTGEFENFDPAAKKVVVDRFFELHAQSDLVGFKVAPYQIDDDLAGFVQHVSHYVQRQIFLTRDNPVQSALSQLWSNERAKQGLPARIVKGEDDTVVRSRVDQAEFEYYVINSMLERESVLALSRLAENPLVFSYETLCSDQTSVFDGIKQYLNVPNHVELVKSDLVKVRTDGAASHVANIDDVEHWVAQMGLDTTLLHQELAQIGAGSGCLAVPQTSLEKMPGPSGRRRDARSFLASRIIELRSATIATARDREGLAARSEAIIHSFSERALEAERFNARLQERIELLQSMHTAAQRTWEESAKRSLEHARQLEARAGRAEAFSKDETSRLRALLDASGARAQSKAQENAQANAAMQDRAERAEQYNTVVKHELASARQAHESDRQAWELCRQQASIHAAELEARALRAEAYSADLLSAIEQQRAAAAAIEHDRNSQETEQALELSRQQASIHAAELEARALRAEAYSADLLSAIEQQRAAAAAMEHDRKSRETEQALERSRHSIHAAELEARALRAEAYSANLLSAIEELRNAAATMEQEFESRTAALKSRVDRTESYNADLRRLIDEARATIKEKDNLLGQQSTGQHQRTRQGL